MEPILTPDPEAGALAERVQASLASDDPARSLHASSLSFLRTLAQSVGIPAPAGSLVIAPALIASVVGGPGALAFALGALAMGFVAYAFVVFARSFNSAGSVYAFNGAALGPSYGFFSGSMLLVVYTVAVAGAAVYAASIGLTLLDSLGVHAWWGWIAGVAWLLAMLFAYFWPIGLSSLVIFVCEGLAIIIIAVVCAAVVIKGGVHGNGLSAAPFELHGTPLAILGLGVTISFASYGGIEGAAVLGEESKRPTRTIPAAIGWSLVAVAAAFVTVTWIIYSAYRSPQALASDPAPMVHVATRYVGSAMGTLMSVAGLISLFGAEVACTNGATRILFALGREVGGGRQARNVLVRTSPRTRAPIGALRLVAAGSLAALTVGMFERSSTQAIVVISEYGALLLVLVYSLTVFAALAWTWRHHRRGLSLVLLSLGLLTLVYVIYRTYYPWPPAPFSSVALIALPSVLAGVVLAVSPAVRRRLASSELLIATRKSKGDAGDHAASDVN